MKCFRAKAIIATLGGALMLLSGCGRTPAHLDAVPRPTGTADVLRFELAWSEDGLRLDEAKWREVEEILDEGHAQWSRWVRTRWIPFVEEVWEREGQPWQEDPERVEEMASRAAALRQEAMNIDMTMVARIGMVAGPEVSDAAERFSAVRRLERASALAAGYSRKGSPPKLPEDLLSDRSLSESARMELRRALAETANSRAKLLEDVVDRRFAMDLAGAGDEEDDNRKKLLKQARLDFTNAIATLEEANDAAMMQIQSSLQDEKEREDFRYHWLRTMSDPDSNYRAVGDAIYEMVARSRSVNRRNAARVREVQQEFEQVDAEILEEFKSLRTARGNLQREGKTADSESRSINRLRRKRRDVFWDHYEGMKEFIDPVVLDRISTLAKKIPDFDSTINRLVPIVGGADAEAIAMMIPPKLFGDPVELQQDRLISENVLEVLLSDPMGSQVPRDALRAAPDGVIDLVLTLHDQYLQDYAAIYERAKPGLIEARDGLNDAARRGMDLQGFATAAFRLITRTDVTRRECIELDKRFFVDAHAVSGLNFQQQLNLARDRRRREVEDLVLDDGGAFGAVFLGPGSVELAEAIDRSGIEMADRIAAEEILLQLSEQMIESRELHRTAALAAIVAFMVEAGERSIRNEGTPDQRETLEFLQSRMSAGLSGAEELHEEFLAKIQDSLTDEGAKRVRMAWLFQCHPELAFIFAPDKPDEPGEGIARLVAFGRFNDRLLDPGEIAVLSALLDEWMQNAELLLEKAFQLRRKTPISEVIEDAGDWRGVFRRFPEYTILEQERRELNARTARQVISLLGPEASRIPWVRDSVSPESGTSSWAGW